MGTLFAYSTEKCSFTNNVIYPIPRPISNLRGELTFVRKI